MNQLPASPLPFAADTRSEQRVRVFVRTASLLPERRQQAAEIIREFQAWCTARGLRWEAVTAADAYAYARDLAMRESPPALRHRVRLLRRLFFDLMASGLCTANPFAAVPGDPEPDERLL
jgi:hypothetical protein